MNSPQTQRNRLLALADQLRSGNKLTPQQCEHLAACFEAMGRGEDGNSVFGLSYGQGRSEADENRRKNLRLIFSWIAGAIDPQGEGSWTLTKALDEAAKLSLKKGTPFKPISRSALERAWYSPKYRYLKDVTFSSTDLHSPIDYRTPRET